MDTVTAANLEREANLPIKEMAPESLRYQYWRTPRGDIVVAPSWPMEYKRLKRDGWTPLGRYGKFLLNNILTDKQEKRVGVWRVNEEPYRQILLKGGAKEFSVAQVMEHGWHRKPPYDGVTFPQLACLPHVDSVCSFCGRLFLSDADVERHEQIIHTSQIQDGGSA